MFSLNSLIFNVRPVDIFATADIVGAVTVWADDARRGTVVRIGFDPFFIPNFTMFRGDILVADTIVTLLRNAGVTVTMR